MVYTGAKSMATRKEVNHKYMVFEFVGGDGECEVSAAEVQEDIPWDVCA